MLRVDDRKGFSLLFPMFTRSGHETPVALKPTEPAPAVPLIARDAFVAETASKIEQVQATLRLLGRDVSRLSTKVGEIESTTDQDHRWYAFQQSEKRAREGKLDEAVRCCRDLKARLDRIEAHAGGNYHAYNGFDAISRKLSELEDFKNEARRLERSVIWRARILCGVVLVAFVVVVMSGFLPNY